jgi:hypothetical protein
MQSLTASAVGFCGGAGAAKLAGPAPNVITAAVMTKAILCMLPPISHRDDKFSVTGQASQSAHARMRPPQLAAPTFDGFGSRGASQNGNGSVSPNWPVLTAWLVLHLAAAGIELVVTDGYRRKAIHAAPKTIRASS